jgi:DNA-binding NarL/FixJ family response regulator
MSETNRTSEPIRILVVDDHAIVRKGLVALLNTVEGLSVVGEASDGEQAILAHRSCKPDVTLMDLRLPKIGGADAIARIRQETPAARIIVLTTFDGDEDIFRALQAGAKGYLLKGMDATELTEAIHAVYAGKSKIPAVVAEKLAGRMGGPELTTRELEVLKRIVAGRSNKEIGGDLHISEATVKTHINSILGKLGVSDRTQAATTALQRGIVYLE